MGLPYQLNFVGTVLIHGQMVTLVKLSPAAPYSGDSFHFGPCNFLHSPSFPPEAPSRPSQQSVGRSPQATVLWSP